MAIREEKAAKDLLALERLYQEKGSFDDAQAKRWHELITRVFGEQNAKYHRRSFRLPAVVPCAVKIGEGKFDCSIQEISLLGLTLSGEVLSHITHDLPVEILSAAQNGKTAALNMPCEVARLDPAAKPPRAGLTFASRAGSDKRKQYFDSVYYPLYLRYLESLAGATGKRAKSKKAVTKKATTKRVAKRAKSKKATAKRAKPRKASGRK